MMTGQEKVITRKQGRPATGRGTLIGVRLQLSNLSTLDSWISGQPDPKPSRPEAIRRLVEKALEAGDGSIAAGDMNASRGK